MLTDPPLSQGTQTRGSAVERDPMLAEANGDCAFRVSVEQNDRETRVTLEGEIDLSARVALRDAIGLALEHHRLVLDVTNVSFVDSTGIGAIARAVRAHADVTVVGPQPLVRRALEVSGIDRHIEVIEDSEQSK